MSEAIEQKIDELKQMLSAIKIDSPRMTRNEAKKFLGIGEDKFRILKMRGIIKERVDHFGARYFLKHELLKVLEDNRPLQMKRAI